MAITLTGMWQTVSSATVTSNGASVKFKLEAYYDGRNVTANTDKLHVRLRSEFSGYYWRSDYHTFKADYCPTVSGGAWNIETENITVGETTITHDADGTKKMTLHGSARASEISVDLKGDVIFPPIPRASKTTYAGSTVIGEDMALIVNRASTNFTHNLTYTFGNASGTIREGVTDGTVWTIPTSLMSEIPTATEGLLTLTTETFSGGVSIGKSITTATLTVDVEKYHASVSVTLTDDDSKANTVHESGSYVRYRSKAHITGSVDMGISGATVKKVAITSDGLPTSTTTSTDIDYIIDEVNCEGIVITVTDSRNVVTEHLIEWDLIPYLNLTATGSAHRPEPTGDVIRLNANGDYYNGIEASSTSFQNTLRVSYTFNGSAGQTVLQPTVIGNSWKIENLEIAERVSSTQTAVIVLTIEDKITSLTQTIVVPVGVPVYSWGIHPTNHFDVFGALVIHDIDAPQNTAKLQIVNDKLMLTLTINGETTQREL